MECLSRQHGQPELGTCGVAGVDVHGEIQANSEFVVGPGDEQVHVLPGKAQHKPSCGIDGGQEHEAGLQEPSVFSARGSPAGFGCLG